MVGLGQRSRSTKHTVGMWIGLGLVATGAVALAGCSGPAAPAQVGAVSTPTTVSSSPSGVPSTTPSTGQTTSTAKATSKASPSVAVARSATPTARPSASPSRVTPTPRATATRKPTPTATPSPAPYFTVVGNVARTTTFTVAQLEKMATVSATYFSRGGHPTTEEETPFVGVRLIDILDAAGMSSSASRVTVTGADNYSATFTVAQVTADYIDETRPGVELPMIIAYSEDGKQYTGDHPFRLVMGETVAGEYNRMYWVSIVKTITVQ